MDGHQLAMTIRDAYLSMHRQTNASMSKSNVTADQFVVLAALAEGDAVTQRELVDRTASDPNTLRAMLVLLEKQRLVERRPHPTDGRARTVSLTRRGKAVLKKLWRQSEAVRASMLSTFSPREVSTLMSLLKRLTIKMNNEEISTAGRPRRAAATSRS